MNQTVRLLIPLLSVLAFSFYSCKSNHSNWNDLNADSLYNGHDYALKMKYLFTDTSSFMTRIETRVEYVNEENVFKVNSEKDKNGNGNGIYILSKSVNGGRNWAAIQRINCREKLWWFDVSDAGRCLALFFPKSIYYSCDSGSTFKCLAQTCKTPWHVSQSFFDCQSKHFFIDNYDQGIVCSVSGQQSLFDTINFKSEILLTALYEDTLKVYTSNTQVFKSADWGKHWKTDSTESPIKFILSSVLSSGYISMDPDFRHRFYKGTIFFRNESIFCFKDDEVDGRFVFGKMGEGKLSTYFNPEFFGNELSRNSLLFEKGNEIYRAELVPPDYYSKAEAFHVWEDDDSLYFSVKIKKGSHFDGNIHYELLGGQAFDYRRKVLSEKFICVSDDSTEWITAFNKASVGIPAGIRDFNLELMYRDSGKENHYQLGTFHYPPNQFWQSKEFITTVFFSLLVLIFLLTQLSKRSAPLFSKWFPVTLWLVTTSATTVTGFLTTSLKDRIDTDLLLLYLLLSIPVLLAVGIVRPSFFKSIAGVAPFHLLTPLVSVWPYFRKRYYAEYIHNLVDKLGTEKLGRLLVQGGSPVIENYTPIPAIFFTKGSPEKLQLHPVEELICYVDPAEDETCNHILIVAPGGQGKSALVREFLGQYLQLFRSDPALPLPVYLNGSGREITDIQELIKDQLGRFLLSAELFTQELKAGRYFLIIDGLSEAVVKPGALANFVAFQNEAGVHTQVIITTRPNAAIEHEMRQSTNWVEVRPKKLDDDTVKVFVQVYLGEGKQLAEHLRRICRSGNGEYLPILVKLAVIANKEQIDDISALYQKAAEILLKCEERADFIEILDNIASLCGTMYGQTGNREIFKTAGNKELIDILANCGLLLPITNNDRLQVTPRTYRFFHDSIQTYFTACWFLMPELQQPDKVQALFRDFVIKDIYQKDKADIIFRNGSELFQMAVLTFQRHGINVAALFIKELKQLTEQYKTKYSVENVVKATSAPFAANVDGTALANMQEALAAVQGELYLLSELYHNFILLIADKLKKELPQ
jgi:hypothetical protein